MRALLARFATATARGARLARPLESAEQWGARVLGRQASRWLLGPTVQGIHAADPARLSASLAFGAPKGFFVVGNYVAGIGLPMLLEQAAGVATRVREMR